MPFDMPMSGGLKRHQQNIKAYRHRPTSCGLNKNNNDDAVETICKGKGKRGFV